MKKPKPPILHRLWPNSGTGKAAGYCGINLEWSDEYNGWIVWRESTPEHRVVLHGRGEACSTD